MLNRFHTKFIVFFVVDLHTNFQMLSLSGSLVITMKLKAKYKFYTASVLFYILQLLQGKLHYTHVLPIHI